MPLVEDPQELLINFFLHPVLPPIHETGTNHIVVFSIMVHITLDQVKNPQDTIAQS